MGSPVARSMKCRTSGKNGQTGTWTCPRVRRVRAGMSANAELLTMARIRIGDRLGQRRRSRVL